jgi:hypothetical protein
MVEYCFLMASWVEFKIQILEKAQALEKKVERSSERGEKKS